MITIATSSRSSIAERLARGARLDQVLAELGEDRLVGQELAGLVVDQQDVQALAVGGGR